MSFKVVELSGQCKLQFKTSMDGRCTITVNKLNLKGENNADSLINEVFHFGVMRHGKKELRRMFEEKLSKYDEEFEEKGIK